MSADVLGLIACPSTVPEHDNQQRGGGKGAVHSLMVGGGHQYEPAMSDGGDTLRLFRMQSWRET
ncbi:hypothetical protein [Mycobacteroides abscessus]|uniref:hypothetical protein n=1 Tax=Mycobacteroides abscessus TaxID=36809 RepID=UPI0018966259